MNRYCFLLQVRPESVAEYRRRHETVWPEMLRALREAGWANYSLFIRGDGLLVGYVESDDLERARTAMASTDVNTRWQAEMAELLIPSGDQRPGESLQLLDEVFHLEDQLALCNGATGARTEIRR